MKLSKEDAVAKFRRHWEILGTEGNAHMTKYDALEIMQEEAGFSDCFLCEYTNQFADDCSETGCIIDWGKLTPHCVCENSLYIRWGHGKRVLPSGKETLARKISKLPINKSYTGE